jgi:hypothetical protein
MSVLRYVLTLAAVVFCSRVACAQYALFSRPTDTIEVAGHTVINTTITIEAELNPASGGGNGFYQDNVFTEQKSGQTAKLLCAGPTGMSGQAWTLNNAVEMTSSTVLTPEQWHHVAFVHNGTLEQLYADGALVGTRDLSGMPSTWTIWNSMESWMSIGAFHLVPTDDPNLRPSFLGLMDWVRVSDTARYSGNSYSVPTTEPTSDASTLLLYTFDDAADSTVAHDSGPNHWDGALGIGPSYFTNPTSPTFVPEPACIALLGFGAATLSMRRRGRRG